MSKTIDAIRAKYPQYAAMPDEKLVPAIGAKYPTYLESDKDFAADFQKLTTPGYVRAPADPGDVEQSTKAFFALKNEIEDAHAAPDEETLRQWHPTLWQKFRTSDTGHRIFGPTDLERQEIAKGVLAGAPGNNPGIVPIMMATPGPWFPANTTAAGKALLGYFVASNLKEQPEIISQVSTLLKSPGKENHKKAYRLMLEDALNLTMTAGAAKGLHEGFTGTTGEASEPQPKEPTEQPQSSQPAAAAAAPAPPVASTVTPERHAELSQLGKDMGLAFDGIHQFPGIKPLLSFTFKGLPQEDPAFGATFNADVEATPEQILTKAKQKYADFQPDPPQTETTLAKAPVVEFPVDQLKLSKDVPNFKGGASEETGTVPGEELSGKYERLGTAPIVAWERLNGDKEVITGRHRFDLARRTGEKTIPTQLVREKDGFTKAMALTFDAEANIRDGQGDVSDYAIYFKGHPEYTEEAASARGLLARAKGRAGWDIGKNASDDLFALWQADKISDAQTMAIAKAAPGDAAAQQIGSKFALEGRPADFLINVIKASQAGARERAQNLDLFGKDDSAMKQMALWAQRAGKYQAELRRRLQAISGAAKNPEVARQENVDVKDSGALAQRMVEIQAELKRWDNWPLQPDLVEKVRGQKPAAAKGETPKTPPSQDKIEPENAAPGATVEEVSGQNASEKPETGETPEMFREQIGAHPVDNRTVDSVSSVYGVKPEQVQSVLQDSKPYQQSFGFAGKESPVPVSSKSSSGPGQPKRHVTPRVEAERQALKTLDAAALSKAFGYSTRISSIDPKTAPHDIPQYRVNGTVINTPADFAKTLISLRSPYTESLKIAILDKNNVAVHSQVLYSGTLDATVLDPRDFTRLANKFKGSKILISHNHPSGEVTPSGADIQITRKVEDYVLRAGFEFVDHIITNGRKFFSLKAYATENIENSTYDIENSLPAPWEKVAREDLKKIEETEPFSALVKALRQSNQDVAHIIYLTTRHGVTAIERTVPNMYNINRALLAGIGREGALQIVVDFGPNVDKDTASLWTRQINNETLKGTSTKIVDFAARELLSGTAALYAMREEPLFGAPESVEEQKTRLAAEAKKRAAAEQAEQLKTLAAKPLVGSRGDIGQKDLFGGGDLLNEKAPGYAAMGSAAPRPAAKPGSIQPPQQLAKAPAPALGALDAWWLKRTMGFRRIFAPQTIDAGAAETAYVMRELLGEKAAALQRAEKQMADLRKEFDWTPVPEDYVYDENQPLPHNYAVIDALERNRAALPPRYQKLGELLDREFAWRIDVIRRFAPNALKHLIENYFPHLWEHPERAQGVMAQIATKHFAGAKEFLKQRSLPLLVDGLARGLKPINDNPVDLLLAKMHSMDQMILSVKAQAQFKASGKMKFNYWAESPADGHVRLDDPAFILHAPPFVEFKEGFDDMLRTRTLEGLTRLGIETKRLASLGGKRWGLAMEQGKEVRTRFGGDTWIYWHEMGHQMDYAYPDLRRALGMSSRIDKNGRQSFGGTKTTHDEELRELADLRLPEGDTGVRRRMNKKKGKMMNVRSSFSQYTRTPEEKIANVFHAYLHAPELFKTTAPNVARALDGWFEKHPDVRDVMNEIRQPSLRLGVGKIQVPTAGPVLLGYWTMPDGPAQVIKNYLSPGLIRFKAFQGVRSASNLLNAAQLGFSGFHLGFTSLDATVNAVEVGLFQALHGRPGQGLLTGTLKAAVAPIANYYVGKAIRTAMLDPKATTVKVWGMDVKMSQAAHDYAQLAIKAGLRATMDPFWKTHFTRGLVRAMGQVRNTWENTEGMAAPLKAAWATKSLPLRAAAAIAEQAMRPIAEFLVPNQKLGVFALLAKSELQRLNPNASEVEIQAALARSANATEDRMGQMTYDNLFYNRMAKDLALLATRSYGWQFGKYRHLAGAVSDTAIGTRRLLGDKSAEQLNKPEGITHRQLYFIALPMVLGAIGGILHYLWTGRRPKDTVDLLHPSTGQVDAYGQEKRVSLPSYWKDLEADWYGMHSGLQNGGPAGAARGLWDSTYQRANPWINEIVEMLRNRDFYGQQIYSPTDPLDKQVWEQAAYMAKSFEPFSVSQSVHLSAGDSSTMEKILPFIGIVPAKQGLVLSPAQMKAGLIIRDMMPDVAQTAGQKAHAKLVSDLVHDLRTGQINDEGQFEARARGAAVKNKAELTKIKERVLWTPFQYQIHKLPLLEPGTGRDAMTVWDLMSAKEKMETAPFYADKIQRAYDGGNLDPETAGRLVRLVMPYLKAAMAAKAKQPAASGPAAGRSSMYQQ